MDILNNLLQHVSEYHKTLELSLHRGLLVELRPLKYASKHKR